MVFVPQTNKPGLIWKILDKSQTRNILQRTWLVLLKTVKIIKKKKNIYLYMTFTFSEPVLSIHFLSIVSYIYIYVYTHTYIY